MEPAMESALEPWPEGLAEDLESPEAFGPEAVGSGATVEIVQTHLSRVFLVGDRVYKLPRAVDVGFVSFARRAERTRECRREVALNRRLAPDVYLGAAPVVRSEGRHRIGPLVENPDDLGDDREAVVVMRRLPEGRDAQSLLERGLLDVEHVQRLAERLATFHRQNGLGRPAPFEPDVWQARNADPIRANFDTLERAAGAIVDEALVAALRDATEKALVSHAPRFEARRREGRAVDAHGDLHLQHVWFESDEAQPIAIDGLVFREDLRRIDAASEMAFLAMDLRYRDRGDLAEHLLAHYAASQDDYGLYEVVDLFASYRAAVRAKVAALAAMDPAIDPAQRERSAESTRRHVAAALAHLERPAPGPLVAVGGTVGSGKSTVARALARRAGAPVLGSDALRTAVLVETPSSEARYSRAARDRVYDGLFERAARVLASGRPVLLDATFARRAHRDAARRIAQQAGAQAFWVEAACDRETALERLAQRAARGDDASEAGPAQLEGSIREFEREGDWPEADTASIRTDAGDTEAACTALAARLGLDRP
jgi:aminoglycoside phosphotransferase family enzyme/predicted kinase